MNDSDIRAFISDGVDRAKQGQAIDVYNAILPSLKQGTVPAKNHYAAGWIIYYALHQSPDTDIEGRKRMLARYLGLNTPRPHKLHSMILTEVIRLYKNAKDAAFAARSAPAPAPAPAAFSILKFCNLWGLPNLRPGDWKRKSLDQKDLSSTVEKLITVCADEFEAGKTPLPDGFIGIIEKACQDFPDSFNLMAQYAKILRETGNRNRAAELIRNALLLAPGKFFLWDDLASIIDIDQNPRLRVALLAKALDAPGAESFKGRIRLRLADVWIHFKEYSRAAWELQRVRKIYETSSWHLPKEWERLNSLIPEFTRPTSPEDAYQRLLPLAYDEIYSRINPIRVTKNYHKPASSTRAFGSKAVQRTAWRVADDQNNNFWLQPEKFGIDPELPIGTPLLIRLYNGKPVKAELAE